MLEPSRTSAIGITPAPAGSTKLRRLQRCCHKDHPRACGEHSRSSCKAASCSGSPPRLRGARIQGPLLLTVFGITPAPAGSTESHVAYWDISKDHPRACGEHCYGRVVRLKHKDHPRACGEHTESLFSCKKMGGSPPRLRGALSPCLSSLCASGITPAPAGSTCEIVLFFACIQDHPRACGGAPPSGMGRDD